MKKLSLFCLTLLAALSLSACGSQSSHHSKAASSHISKVVKHHHKKHSKKKKADKQSSSSATQSSQTSQQSGNQTVQSQSQQNAGPTDEQIQAEIHRRNTAAQNAREQPYKGYDSYYDYKNANPDQSYSENDDPAYTTGAIPRDGN